MTVEEILNDYLGKEGDNLQVLDVSEPIVLFLAQSGFVRACPTNTLNADGSPVLKHFFVNPQTAEVFRLHILTPAISKPNFSFS